MSVSTVDEGPRAIEMLHAASRRGHPYQLVILDMHMPRMDGLDVARAVSADPAIAGVPMVLLSSVCHAEKNEAMRAAGILRHLTKPARQSELYDCITDAMQGDWGTAGLATAKPAREPGQGAQNLEGRILLVEDNAVNREVARYMLDDVGCEVVCAGNGREALDTLQDNAFDVVLMDCQMPEMDGFAATRELRKREAADSGNRHLPVVALTANAMDGDRERCLAAGMDDYLSKPLAQAELVSVLAKWLPGGDDKGIAPEVTTRSKSSEPAEVTPAPDHNPINSRALDNIRNLHGGEAILAKVIDLYLDDSPMILDELRDCVARGLPDEMRKAAHKFKSSSANLGADRLAELCKRLEMLGRSDSTAGASALLDELEQEYGSARAALKEMSPEVPA
jgi:two-component system sensor histidine kinase/response regulator